MDLPELSQEIQGYLISGIYVCPVAPTPTRENRTSSPVSSARRGLARLVVGSAMRVVKPYLFDSFVSNVSYRTSTLV
jgi:hypothetical protein